jgi:hypothetical protein
MTALAAARRRRQEDIARLSLSVPRADDPELAEHALWNDMIAADAEEMALAFEADPRVQELPDIFDLDGAR